PTDMMPTMAIESATLTRLAIEKNVDSTKRPSRIPASQTDRPSAPCSPEFEAILRSQLTSATRSHSERGAGLTDRRSLHPTRCDSCAALLSPTAPRLPCVVGVCQARLDPLD